MLTKYGAILSIAEVSRFQKQAHKFPVFVQDNERVMQRMASIEPIMLDPERFLYMRTRMVSAVEKHGPNANGDAFEHEQLAARHPTFIRAAVNIDHDNDDPKKAVGFVLDAVYKPDEMYVEGVHAIDRVLAEARRPGIIRDIEAKLITDTSMGCFVEASICSECLKEAGWDGKWDVDNPDKVNRYVAMLKPGKGIASVPDEYCRHIGKFGEKKGGLGGPYEINRDFTFFEDSIITTAGADKDAKYLEKIAQLKSTDWMKYLIHRTLVNGAVVEASQKSKGAEAMDKVKEAEKKTAEESELNKKENVSREDKGDVGDGHKKYDEQASEAKGKSEGKDDDSKGSLLSTMEGKGDYALAMKENLEAIAKVKALAKTNPKEVQALLFELAEKEGVCPGCGKPYADCSCDKKEGNKKEEEVNKDEKKEEKIAKKSMLDRLIDKFGARPLLAALMGNQLETMEDKGDYGDGSAKYKEQAAEAKGTSDSKDDEPRGSQLMTMEGKGDLPLKSGAKVEKKAEEHVDPKTLKSEGEEVREKSMEGDGKEKERMAKIVEKLQKGANYDDASEKTAEEKESRAARRKKLADEQDLNRGSMGGGGTEKDADEPGEKLKDFHEKVEAPASKKMEDMEEKAVGASKKEAGNELDKGNEETLDTEEIRKDNGRKVGSKKEAAEEMDMDHKIEEGTPSPEELEMEKSDGGGAATMDPGMKKEEKAPPGREEQVKELKKKPGVDNPFAVAWKSYDESHKAAKEDEMDKAKDVVDKMDEKEAGLRRLIEAKKDRAQVMAKAGYKTAAIHHVAGIEVLEAHADKLLMLADKAANLIEGSEKLDKAKKTAVYDTIHSTLKLAEEEMASTKKDIDEMKPEDMKKEEQYTAAKRVLEAENRAKIAEAKSVTAQQKVADVIKARVVAETVKLGARKGAITAANRDEMIEKLSAMNPVQFDATVAAWKALPDQVHEADNGFVKKEIREAGMKPESLGELVPKKASDQALDSLDDPDFFK